MRLICVSGIKGSGKTTLIKAMARRAAALDKPSAVIANESGEESYEPDFVVETESALYLCEPKRASELDDDEVQAKARAAAVWCRHASAVAAKPWSYLLVPHDAITDNKTMQGLAASYTFTGQGT